FESSRGHQTKAWHAMRGFFHFNPLQACLNKVKWKKTRTAKASELKLISTFQEYPLNALNYSLILDKLA
ncbi:MAG: hypothetical protein RL110_640, partial [Bacteroidota bacterium]